MRVASLVDGSDVVVTRLRVELVDEATNPHRFERRIIRLSIPDAVFRELTVGMTIVPDAVLPKLVQFWLRDYDDEGSDNVTIHPNLAVEPARHSGCRS